MLVWQGGAGLPKVLRFWIVDINSFVRRNGFELGFGGGQVEEYEYWRCREGWWLLRVEIVVCERGRRRGCESGAVGGGVLRID